MMILTGLFIFTLYNFNLNLISSQTDLSEKLAKIKFGKTDGPLLASFSSEYPKFTDIICEPVSGRKGVENKRCFIDNVCYNVKGDYLEISKEGYRENTNTNYFVLNSYRENNYPNSVVQAEFVRYFNEELPKGQLHILSIGNPTLLFQRFVASNIMHTFHDTWLPLLLTIADTPELRDLEDGKARFLIGFDRNGNHYDEIYRWLGKYHQIQDFPFILGQSDSRLKNLTHICFENGVFGLSTSSQWYQYGYKQPEGPVLNLDKDFAGKNVRAAVDWLKTSLNIPKESKRRFVSIVSRKSTRLILNEEELKEKIQSAFPQYEVKIIGEELMTLTEMIATIHDSAVMIGMHGALMILSMFLPPGSKLIEMYFFGVNPENYAPYRTLASLTGMNITYRTWSNPHEFAPYNYAHEDRHPHFGGISHLPASMQQAIKTTKLVPRHRCCYFSMWIYRAFQDTHVNVTEIINIMKEGL